MKNIKKELSYYEIEKKSQTKCVGGVSGNCQCGCLYEGTPSGSSTHENSFYNWMGGLKSPSQPK